MQLDKNTWIWIFKIAVVTGAVYLLFRYLLLLLLPFLLALLLAALLRPAVGWLRKRLHLPAGLAAGFCVCLFLAAVVLAVWKLAEILLRQAMTLVQHLPGWLESGVCRLEQFCCRVENQILLKPGTLTVGVRNLMNFAGERLSEEGISLALDCSLPVLQTLIRIGVVIAFSVFAAVLMLSGAQEYRESWEKLPFSEELSRLAARLKQLAGSWLRCELLAMLLTCLVCVVGIWLTGNSYALLLGLVIGLLDALPLVGTGTVLLPWALIAVLGGNTMTGVILAATYGICYWLRQLLETRMLGESLGSSPLTTLLAMYVGMELFGLAGLLLGPAAFLLIREILALEKERNEEKNA